MAALPRADGWSPTPLIHARSWAAAERHASKKGSERLAWWIVTGLIGAALLLAVRHLHDPGDAVERRLAMAPVDDEPFTAEDLADVAAARGETSLPWPEGMPAGELIKSV